MGDARRRQLEKMVGKRTSGEGMRTDTELTDGAPTVDDTAFSAEECWEKYREASEATVKLRAGVEELDRRMQGLSSATGPLQAAIEADQEKIGELMAKTADVRKKHNTILDEWSSVVEAGKSCESKLNATSCHISDALYSLRSERGQRKTLRNAIRCMMESLGELDDHLSALEKQDSDFLDDADLASPDLENVDKSS